MGPQGSGYPDRRCDEDRDSPYPSQPHQTPGERPAARGHRSPGGVDPHGDAPYPRPAVITWSATTPSQVQGDSPFPALTRKGSDPGMARSVSGGAPPPSRAPEDHFNPLRRNDLQDPPLSVGASAPPPVRDQGPGRSLPGPDAGIPCKVRVRQEGGGGRARCVPDQAANRGYRQSLTDTSICPLTCVRTGPGTTAHVLLSGRWRLRGRTGCARAGAAASPTGLQAPLARAPVGAGGKYLPTWKTNGTF